MGDTPKQDCAQAQDKEQELQRRLEAERQRADAAEKAAKLEGDRVKALDEKMNAIASRLDAQDKARVDAKRAELATLTKADAKTLPEMPEAALDFAIAREKHFAGTGRSDGSRLGGAPRTIADEEREALKKDGVTVTPYGFTANVQDALAKKGVGVKVGVN